MDCDAFIRGLMGPLGSGKSSACVMELVQRGLRQKRGPDGVRRSRWGVLRNTSKQLEDTTERTFLQWLNPITFGTWTPSKHNFVINTLKGEGDEKAAHIEVMFRALDRPDQIGDLLSLELTGAWVNEAREIPWAVIDALRPRVGRYPAIRDGGASWFGIIMDTNPPDIESDWYRFFETTDHSETVADLARIPGFEGLTVDNFRRLFRQPSGRSPLAENLENLRPGYYQSEAIGKSREWINVYLEGEYGFVMDGKPVWPEYRDVIHCPPKDHGGEPNPVGGQPIVRSWDFGLTPACIFSQITPRGQWIVFDELVATDMGADQLSDAVREHSARYYPRFDFWDVGDPAGAQRSQSDMKTCFQILHSKGLMIEPAIQTLQIRLESVRKPLRTLVDGRPQFVLHPRCKELRRGLQGGYHYRRLRITGERYTEQPEKNQWSHPCDALGYAGTRLFGAGLLEQRGFGESDRAPIGRRSAVTGY